MKVKSEGFIKVAVTNFGEWIEAIRNIPIEAIRNIPIEDMKDVPLDELKSQYKLFLSRLEDITRKYTMEELQNLEAKILIKSFFDQKEKLYIDIEMILQTMAVAFVKHSCESILVSFVSKYENNLHIRNVNEESFNKELKLLEWPKSGPLRLCHN